MSQQPSQEAFMYGTSQSLATSAASARVALTGAGPVVRIFNDSTFTVYIELGNSTVNATADTSYGMPAGGVEVLRLPDARLQPTGNPVWYIAAISPGGAGKLNFQTGEGL